MKMTTRRASASSGRPPDVDVRLSPRASRSLEKFGPGLTQGTFREVGDFLRRHRASPGTVAGGYDRAIHLSPDVVLEFEVGRSQRVLAHWASPRLTIVDVGPHEVVPNYDRRWLARDLASARRLEGLSDKPEVVLRFFGNTPDEERSEFGNELQPEWVYFLASPQANVATAISKAHKRASADKPSVFLVVGGPGTGKTSILVKSMLVLRSAGGAPGIVVTDPVASQIAAGCGLSIGPWRVPNVDGNLDPAGFDVLLYDDPPMLDDVENAILAGLGTARVIVVGFDPSQLVEDVSDERFEQLVESAEAKVYELKACYRQKEALGRAAKRVMDRVAESTPFLAEQKIDIFRADHQFVYRVSNDVYFPNPHGYERTYRAATPADLKREASRIRKSPLWEHTTPVLLAVDSTCDVDWPWPELLRGIPYQEVDFDPESRWSALASIKGVEFQHAILVIGAGLFMHLETGFGGSGQSLYHARRMLRIPFTRAKDSLVTLVIRTPEEPRTKSKGRTGPRQSSRIVAASELAAALAADPRFHPSAAGRKRS